MHPSGEFVNFEFGHILFRHSPSRAPSECAPALQSTGPACTWRAAWPPTPSLDPPSPRSRYDRGNAPSRRRKTHWTYRSPVQPSHESRGPAPAVQTSALQDTKSPTIVNRQEHGSDSQTEYHWPASGNNKTRDPRQQQAGNKKSVEYRCMSKRATPYACRLELHKWRHSQSPVELVVLLTQVTAGPPVDRVDGHLVLHKARFAGQQLTVIEQVRVPPGLNLTTERSWSRSVSNVVSASAQDSHCLQVVSNDIAANSPAQHRAWPLRPD